MIIKNSFLDIFYNNNISRYDVFRVYGYFYNLVISRVIINTLLCNAISLIVKSLSCRSHR